MRISLCIVAVAEHIDSLPGGENTVCNHLQSLCMGLFRLFRPLLAPDGLRYWDIPKTQRQLPLKIVSIRHKYQATKVDTITDMFEHLISSLLYNLQH